MAFIFISRGAPLLEATGATSSYKEGNTIKTGRFNGRDCALHIGPNSKYLVRTLVFLDITHFHLIFLNFGKFRLKKLCMNLKIGRFQGAKSNGFLLFGAYNNGFFTFWCQKPGFSLF